MWNVDLESQIIKCGKENNKKKLKEIRGQLIQKFDVVNYNLNRFMEENGETFESNPNQLKIFETISDDYSIVERLFKVLKAYDKTNN